MAAKSLVCLPDPVHLAWSDSSINLINPKSLFHLESDQSLLINRYLFRTCSGNRDINGLELNQRTVARFHFFRLPAHIKTTAWRQELTDRPPGRTPSVSPWIPHTVRSVSSGSCQLKSQRPYQYQRDDLFLTEILATPPSNDESSTRIHGGSWRLDTQS